MSAEIGFRVLKRRRAVGHDWIERFRGIPVACISDCMHRMAGFGPRLRPYHAGGVLCGAALTVRTRPGDNLMAHAALAMAEPGDVLVVDAGGDLTNSIAGERMMVRAQARAMGGFVINGAIRDLDWVGKNRFPVYAAGVHHRGPYKTGPGEVNVLISIHDQVVHPGDLIIGDADGLLCIPLDDMEALFTKAKAKFDKEAATFAMLGNTDQAAEKSRLFAELERAGCDVEA